MNQIGVIRGIERKIGVWSDRLTETESDLAAQEAIIAAPFAKQAELDTKTSIMQIPALFKHKAGKFGNVNIDIGGGRFDLATNYLASIGTTVSKKAAHRCGLLFGDPYGNRTSIILQISFNAIRTNDNFITGMDFIKGYFYICVVQSVVLFI